jgi:hypothetical protein
MSELVQQPAANPGMRFSLRNLFLASTLIAVGIGGLTLVARGEWDLPQIGLVFGIWYGSSALLGAGLLTPFHKKTIGAVLGFLLGWPLLQLLEYLLTV